MCNRAFAGPESTLQNFTKTSEENIKVYEVWLSQQKIFIINLFQMLRRRLLREGSSCSHYLEHGKATVIM